MYATPLMEFYNKYGNYHEFEHISTDDGGARVFPLLKVFMDFTERGGRIAPQGFTWILHRDVHRALILSVREFKPYYWALRSWTWQGLLSHSITTLLRTDMPDKNRI